LIIELLGRGIVGKYQGYENYKESGVEWLGEIPEHWKTKKIQHIGRLKSGENIVSQQIGKEGLYPVFGGNGLRGYFDSYTHDGHYILIGRQGALCGNINYGSGRFWASEHAVVVLPSSKFNVHWLGGLLETMNLNQYSTSAAQPGLSAEQIGRLKIPFPPLDEQESIAHFLDRKTSQIDTLIAKKSALLEKLDEKRTALISHAVTKGLDSSVPMKDSGVEWLGDIPEHWKRGVKLIQLAQEKQHSFVNGPFGSDLLTAELQDDGIPVIYSGDIKTNKFSRKSSKYVTEEKAIQLNFCRVDSGDLLLAKVGDPPGDAAIYPDSEESGIVTQDVVRIKVDRKKATPEYLALLMNSQTGKFIIKCISVEATRSRFSLGDFKGIRLFIPPLNEQVEISRYGEKILIEIGGQQAKIKEAIELLKEYRTALITNAVTGKIDVRQVARV
jgi:type I restriction enzyme, S subunit